MSRDAIQRRECDPVPASRRFPKEGPSGAFFWFRSMHPKRESSEPKTSLERSMFRSELFFCLVGVVDVDGFGLFVSSLLVVEFMVEAKVPV